MVTPPPPKKEYKIEKRMSVLKVNMAWEKKLKSIYYRHAIMNVGVLRKCRLKKKDMGHVFN